MTTPEENGSEQQEHSAVEREVILELNFVPDWARKPPQASRYRQYEDVDGGDRRRSRRQEDRRYGRPDARRRTGAGGDRGRGTGRPSGPSVRREMPREQGPREPFRQHRESPRPRHEPLPIAPVTVRFLPEDRQLSSVVRQIKTSSRSYPLMDVAGLFMSTANSCRVKIEIEEGREAVLYQCKACRTAALDPDILAAHALKAHLEEYFDVQEREVDPPSGAFTCIARCGFSGELLGPPNDHSYRETVREMHKTRFAHMPFKDYQDRIETLHDDALIEKWKQSKCKRTVLTLKKTGDEEALEMSQPEAERWFIETVQPGLITKTNRVVMPEAAARSIDDRVLRGSVRQAWEKENRFPFSLSLALRAAFRHRDLYVFKAGKGITFVTGTSPVPLDPEFVVADIREVLLHLRDHPGCKRDQLVADLRPETKPGSEEATHILAPLRWLIDRGHIIEFFDGSLSVPLNGSGTKKVRPKSRPRKTR